MLYSRKMPPAQCDSVSYCCTLVARSTAPSVCYAEECRPASIRNIGTHKFILHLFVCLFVCLFTCLFGVKQHGYRADLQNNVAFLATSYQSVIEGVS
jgi:hypothetical protein